MPRNKLKNEKEYICCEQATGRAIQGSLLVTDERIEVRLVSFDEFFYINDDTEFLPLRLEDNSYASMHHVYFGGPGSCASRTQVTHNQTITASTLIHGSDEWKPNDPIRHASFELPRAETLLRYEAKIAELESNSPWSKVDCDVFSLILSGLTIRLGYRRSASIRTERVQVDSPVITLDFDEPRSIESYLNDIQAITHFVSINLSAQMEPENIEIRRLSNRDMHAKVEKGDFLGNHSVNQMWFRRSHPTSEKLRSHFAFAALFDETEMHAFKACLQAWMTREPEWARSNALMMDCLRLQNELSADRLLAACKWLEEIPQARPIQVTNDSTINLISDAAVSQAAKLGYQGLMARIPQSLTRLKFESHRERFDRLLTKITERFGSGVTDNQMTSHLIAALREFRGKVAHGHYEPKDDEEYQRFIKAIYSIEAICVLLTSFDLPMTDDGLRRIKMHPLIERYRLFHVG